MQREEVLAKLRALKPSFKEMNVKRMAIFGSVARGEAGEGSDVDLLLEFDRPAGLVALSQKKREFEEYLGCSVDVYPLKGIYKSIHKGIEEDMIDV